MLKYYSAKQYNALKEERDALQAQLESLQKEKEGDPAAQEVIDGLTAQVDSLTEELDSVKSELIALKQAAPQPSRVTKETEPESEAEIPNSKNKYKEVGAELFQLLKSSNIL